MENEQEYLEYYENSYSNIQNTSLCYLIDKENNKVLIAMKKRGFGVGKWNGVGGKCKRGESIEDALIRETEEEIGVKLISYRKVAVIKFFFAGEARKDWNQKMYVYLADSWNGTPIESEEMKPEWVDIDKIPLDKMWSDDRYWLEKVIFGKMINASFLFDENEEIMDYRIKEVENL